MQMTNGDRPDQVYLRVKVYNLFDVISAIIRQGGQKQAAIAEALELSPDHFSKKFNNPGDCFFTAIDQLDKIMETTGQIAPLEFMALKHGYHLVSIKHPDQSPFDAITKREQAKRKSELNRP